MKLNLGCGADIRLGYANIDIAVDNPNVMKGNFANLDQIGIPNGVCSEILAIDIIKYIPLELAAQILTNWVSKLASSGELYIESVDAAMLGTAMSYSHLDLGALNNMIFGEPNMRAVALYDLVSIEGFLKSLGLTIHSKGINGSVFWIKAVK